MVQRIFVGESRNYEAISGSLLIRLGLERTFDGVERALDGRTGVRDSRDDGNADQSSDQAVFDSGSTRLTLGEASEQFHDNSPNSRLDETLFGL